MSNRKSPCFVIFHSRKPSAVSWLPQQNYLKELGDLAKATDKLDATMFPVDPRIGTDFMRGAQQFVDHIKTNIFVPMHFWDRPAEVVAFRPYAELRGCRYALISVPGEGTDI